MSNLLRQGKAMATLLYGFSNSPIISEIWGTRMYRPSIQSAIIIARLCCAAAIVLIGAWHFIPTFHTYGWTLGIFGAAIFIGLMGAWHEGYATPAKDNRESGNVLFIILICVALFAALTAAMNQSSRSTSTSMLSDQQARLLATEIIQYGNTLEQAVQRLMLKGCSETQLDFSNDVWTTHGGTVIYPTPHASALAPDCSVFHPPAGGAAALNTPEAATGLMAGITSINTGRTAGAIRSFPIPSMGENNRPELLYLANYIRKDVCIQLNDLLNVNNPNGAPPKTGVFDGGAYQYAGAFYDKTPITDPSGALIGKKAFCATTSSDDEPIDFDYIYFHALLVR